MFKVTSDVLFRDSAAPVPEQIANFIEDYELEPLPSGEFSAHVGIFPNASSAGCRREDAVQRPIGVCR